MKGTATVSLKPKFYFAQFGQSVPTITKVLQINGKGFADFKFKDLNIVDKSRKEEYEITAVVQEMLTGIVFKYYTNKTTNYKTNFLYRQYTKRNCIR